MTIEINDRLYNDFVSWAKANGMGDEDMRKYIEKAFRDKFNLDKYGDLNTRLAKEEKPRKTRKKAEPVAETEPVKEPPIIEDVNGYVNEEVNGDVNTSEQINEPEKPKRKTRVIQSK